MGEYLSARTLDLPMGLDQRPTLNRMASMIGDLLQPGEDPIRVAVTNSGGQEWSCEVGVRVGGKDHASVFGFRKRGSENADSFNAVMLVPTGIGAEIGGHAGDAAPAACLLASVCDALVTHPNVLNASDLIHVPGNVLYAEGSAISQMLMGCSWLVPVRRNRLLVIVQAHEDHAFSDATINAVNAARAYYGVNIAGIVMIDSSFRMIGQYTASGSALGEVQGIQHVWDILDARAGEFDAVALSSVIDVPLEYHHDYYELEGDMVNPWGGVEALLTHAITMKYGVPAAHSPMFESREIATLDLGIVDPRMAAEVVSLTFLQSVLRGLQRSPRIASQLVERSAIGAEDIDCLVIPDGCIGLPTLAALEQGITVMAVKENINIMKNDLTILPWNKDQFIQVDNYWEAAGVLAAMKTGLDPLTIRRPLYQAGVVYERCIPVDTAALTPD